MYAGLDGEYTVEGRCYDDKHIEKVLGIIRSKFNDYFNDFLESESGYSITNEDFKKLAHKFGTNKVKSNDNSDNAKKFKIIIEDAIEDFEKDRAKYIDLFDEEALEEYQDDPGTFKSKILANDVPIIHSTLYSKHVKELQKYQYEFRISDPNDLLTVVSNLQYFADNYYCNVYEANSYDDILKYEDLDLSDLDTDDYSVFGVIGGGIKSHMLYKVYPEIFPNRSRSAIWALWYLSDKKVVDCKYGSEFLMIDTHKTITQQNYFYPYELFAFYAHQLYQMLKEKAKANNVFLDPKYRYIFVDVFLTFIAKQHEEEISFFKSQIKDGGYGVV